KPEEPPVKLLDDLFHKTKAAPCIYWLPLTEEQATQRALERAERIKEREKRRKELQEEEDKKQEERRERAKGRDREGGNTGGAGVVRRKEREKGAERQKRGEMATEAVVATPKLQGAADAHGAVATPPGTDDTECTERVCGRVDVCETG
ncbi:hypothetical protein M9458_016362, partial [Cirrhinus mrigala]